MASSREYPSRPLVGVGAVVRRGDRVLLVTRGRPPRQGEWSLPGGLVELGETVFAAAVREVAEETGLFVRPRAIVDVVDLIERDESATVHYHFVLIGVDCDWQGGEARAASDARDAVWATLAQLDRFALRAETLALVCKAFGVASPNP
jgi:8-oxo-dGTP diphosphatase